ncbi:hypothetical protein IWW38_003058, partial [Coemansia aciculifera]
MDQYIYVLIFARPYQAPEGVESTGLDDKVANIYSAIADEEIEDVCGYSEVFKLGKFAIGTKVSDIKMKITTQWKWDY